MSDESLPLATHNCGFNRTKYTTFPQSSVEFNIQYWFCRNWLSFVKKRDWAYYTCAMRTFSRPQKVSFARVRR